MAATVLMTVASLALISFFVGRGQSPTENDRSAVAILAYQSHAHWADHPRSNSDAIGIGLLKLDVGMARLDFANGAALTLQGPAGFEILGPTQTRLHHGILTAHVPDSASGFQVDTPALEVVDLGTAFGVSVGSDGETDVCVFEGQVEVSIAGGTSSSTPLRVTEGSAVRTTPRGAEIEAVAYQTGRFEDSWPVTSGALQTTGLMKFVSPGPNFTPGRYEDSEHILVFAERNGVVLEAAIPVDLVEPGQYQRINRRERNSIGAGDHVRSYLVQLDPIGQLQKKPENRSRVVGQITFDRPIIGLIGSSSKLNATDPMLGHPRGDYGNAPRGIEPPRTDNVTDIGRDLVVLSQDRRTLSLDLSAGSALDQIRVVVRESRKD